MRQALQAPRPKKCFYSIVRLNIRTFIITVLPTCVQKSQFSQIVVVPPNGIQESIETALENTISDIFDGQATGAQFCNPTRV